MTKTDGGALLFEGRDSRSFCAKAASFFLSGLLAISVGLFSVLPSVRGAAEGATTRSFAFPTDSFAFANELLWEYQLDPSTGRMISHPHAPKPDYALHCFVVARSARQFFEHARFDPTEPKATRAVYRHLIHLVVARSSRLGRPDPEPIIIPGYSNLFEFSSEEGALLKSECGGAWQSYLQRGNWRMVFPFSRRHQAHTAQQITRELDQGEPVLVHLVCFPSLALNHVLLLYRANASTSGERFTGYDPNRPGQACVLDYDRAHRQFLFPRNSYFAGGPVNVYEIYRGVFY